MCKSNERRGKVVEESRWCRGGLFRARKIGAVTGGLAFLRRGCHASEAGLVFNTESSSSSILHRWGGHRGSLSQIENLDASDCDGGTCYLQGRPPHQIVKVYQIKKRNLTFFFVSKTYLLRRAHRIFLTAKDHGLSHTVGCFVFVLCLPLLLVDVCRYTLQSAKPCRFWVNEALVNDDGFSKISRHLSTPTLGWLLQMSETSRRLAH